MWRRRIGLTASSVQFGGLQLHQQVACLDSLAFDDRNAQHRAGDLHADIKPMRRLHMAAGDDGLHEVASKHGLCGDLGAQPPTKPQRACAGQDDQGREGLPAMKAQE